MTPKTANDIRLMEAVGRLAADILSYTGKFVKPGITTNELDQIAHEYTLSKGATSAPLGYHGFPKSICTSVNDVVCHGVPDETVLKEGDIINLDVTPLKNGFHGDTSATFYVGQVSEKTKALVECAQAAMMKGIEAIAPGGTIGDIGFAITKYATKKGFHVVKELGGHGIGRIFHDEPFVPSFGKKGRGEPLVKWGTFTVEPMINESSPLIEEIEVPGSSIRYYKTVDGGLSAQFEHTVLITDSGFQILTLGD